MHAASGTTEGHILALIAVGTRAVADVACCRWPVSVRGFWDRRRLPLCPRADRSPCRV